MVRAIFSGSESRASSTASSNSSRLIRIMPPSNHAPRPAAVSDRTHRTGTGERSPWADGYALTRMVSTVQGPHRLAAQDTGLSRRRHGFESRWGYCSDLRRASSRLDRLLEKGCRGRPDPGDWILPLTQVTVAPGALLEGPILFPLPPARGKGRQAARRSALGPRHVPSRLDVITSSLDGTTNPAEIEIGRLDTAAPLASSNGPLPALRAGSHRGARGVTAKVVETPQIVG